MKTLQRDQCGGVAIWFALLLPVLLGFAALAVDLARIQLTKVELQNAADAAALAGARALTDTGKLSGDYYNWSAAKLAALNVAKKNYANNLTHITDANIDTTVTGYWDLSDNSPLSSKRVHDQTESGVHDTGYVPAVSITITYFGLKLFFAPLFNAFRFLNADFNERNIHATAIAVAAVPANGTGMFPMALSSCIYSIYWNSATNTPKLDPTTNKAYVININSVYSGGCNSGQWTSFSLDKNDVPTIRELIANGNSDELKINDPIWIQPGVKATIYDSVPLNIDVTIPVVDNVTTHSEVPIVAIAGFHIESVKKTGNPKYVTGYFIDPKIFPSLNPGSGASSLGALSRPVLVK